MYAEMSVSNTLSSAAETLLVTPLALFRTSFESQMTEIIAELARRVASDSRNTVSSINVFWDANPLATAFNTNWLIKYTDASNDHLIRAVPRPYANSTCTCAISNQCQEPLQIGPPDLILPGLIMGCLPTTGLRMSTLECFYSQTCINTIIDHLEYYTEINGSLPTNFTVPTHRSIEIRPLNSSMSSRFSMNSSVGSILDYLFIEEWRNTSYYANYFRMCNPNACGYQYYRQQDGLYVLMSLLGLYGGLTVALRFFTWNVVRIYVKFRKPTNGITVVPV